MPIKLVFSTELIRCLSWIKMILLLNLENYWSVFIFKSFLYSCVDITGESVLLHVVFCLVMALVWMFKS